MNEVSLREKLRQNRLLEKMLRKASLDIYIPHLVREGKTEKEILIEIRESCKRLLRELK